MHPFLKQIITHKTPVFFLSPHLDDAALSCGGLIQTLSQKTSVTVITIFTDAGTPPDTLSARKTLTMSSHSSSETYYRTRRDEDKQAFASLPVTVLHLGETEALWRKKEKLGVVEWTLGKLLPEFLHVYPTYRLHISRGKIAQSDRDVITRIGQKLTDIIPGDAAVFAPLGIGKHVDHLVVHTVADTYFKPVFWLDQPYLEREKRTSLQESFIGKAEEVPFDPINKERLMKPYTSQLPLLFAATSLPLLKEYFIFPR